MVTPTNHAIAGARFTLRGPGPLELCGFCNIFLPNIGENQKNVLPSERKAPGTVLYGKFDPGYWITLIKRLDESLW